MDESPCCVHKGSQNERTAGIHLSVISQEGLKEGEARRSKERTIIMSHNRYII